MSLVHRNPFLGHRGPVYVLLSEGQDRFLSGSGDGLVVHWQLDRPDDGEVIVQVGQAVFAAHRTRDKGQLLIGTEGGGLHVVDVASKQELHLFQVHRKGIFAFSDIPKERVVVAGGDGSISIWQVGSSSEDAAMTLQRQIPLCEEKVRGLATSQDGSLLAVACGDGTVRILDTVDLNERHTLDAHEGGAQSVAWHPDKPVLVSGGKDGHLRFWNREQQFKALQAFPAHKAGIYAIAFDPSGKCATASRDKTAKLWDSATFDPLARLDRLAGGHSHSVNAVCWVGGTLLTGGDDRIIHAWTAS